MPIPPSALSDMDSFYIDPKRVQPPDVWDTISIRRSWIEEWKERVANDWDVSVLVTGPVGSGKSSLAIGLAAEADTSFTADTL